MSVGVLIAGFVGFIAGMAVTLVAGVAILYGELRDVNLPTWWNR